MALEGTIQDFGLADIFQLIGVQRKSGVLSITSGRETVDVRFVEGSMVGVAPEQKTEADLLGKMMVRSGRITESQLRQALERQEGTLQRLGHILVAEGLISREDLRDALHQQMKEMVFKLFRWKRGRYRFAAEPVDYDRDLVIPLDPQHILMDGVRMFDEWPFIEAVIRSEDMVFRKRPGYQDHIKRGSETETEMPDMDRLFAGDSSASPLERGANAGEIRIRLTPAEEIALSLVDGRRDVRTVIDMSRLGEFDASKALARLATAELIEEVAGGPTPPTAPSARRSVPMRDLLQGATALWGLGGIVLVALLMLWRGVGGGLVLPKAPPGTPHTFQALVSQNRIANLHFAARVFFLRTGRPPTSLQELVTEGLVGPNEIMDPWGRRYSITWESGETLIRPVQ